MAKNGTVYVLSGRYDGLVKIGMTMNKDVTKRVADISINHGPIVIHYTQACSEVLMVEQRAHRLLKGDRFRFEWFKVEPHAAIDAVKEAAELVEIEPRVHIFAVWDGPALRLERRLVTPAEARALSISDSPLYGSHRS